MVSERRALKLKHIAYAMGALVVVACAVFLIVTIAHASVGKGQTRWVLVTVFVAGAIVGISTIIVSKEAPRAQNSVDKTFKAWLKPRPISIVMFAIYTAFGAMATLVPLFAPQPAIEDRPHQIQNGVERIIRKMTMPSQNKVAAVIEKIPGIWGERGCAVTYRFQVKGKALVVDSERRPKGARNWHMIATITNADENILEVRGEEPEESRGMAATFDYITNGETEKLIWNDRVRLVPLELDRCK